MPKRRRDKRSKSVRKRGKRSDAGRRQTQNIRIQIQSAPGAAGGGGGGGGAGSSGGAPSVQYMPQPVYPQMRGREQGRRDVVSGGRQAARPPMRMDVPMAPPPVAAAPLSENAVQADILQAPNILQSDPVHPGEPKAMEGVQRQRRVKMGKVQLNRGAQAPRQPPEAPPAAPELPIVLRDSAPRQSGEVALRENVAASGIVPGSIWARFSKEEFERRMEDARRRMENRRRGAYLPPASRSPVVEEPPSPVIPIPPAMRAAILQPASFRVPPLSGETAATLRAAIAEQRRLEAIKEEMGIPPEAPVASVTSQQLVVAPHTTQEIEPAVIGAGAQAEPSLARRHEQRRLEHEQRRLERRRERFEQKREARKAAEQAAQGASSTIIAGGPTFQFSGGGASLKEETAPSSVAPLVPEAAAGMGVGQQPPSLRSVPFLAQPLVYKEDIPTQRPDRGGDPEFQGPRPLSVAFTKQEREAVEAVPKVFKVGQGQAEPGTIPLSGPAAGFQGSRIVFDE